MSGTTFPPATSPSIALRSRSETGRGLPPTSLAQERLPLREAIPPGAFTLAKHLLLLMIALGVIGILIVLFHGI